MLHSDAINRIPVSRERTNNKFLLNNREWDRYPKFHSRANSREIRFQHKYSKFHAGSIRLPLVLLP